MDLPKGAFIAWLLGRLHYNEMGLPKGPYLHGP